MQTALVLDVETPRFPNPLGREAVLDDTRHVLLLAPADLNEAISESWHVMLPIGRLSLSVDCREAAGLVHHNVETRGHGWEACSCGREISPIFDARNCRSDCHFNPMLPRLLASNTALFVCDVQSCFLKSVYAVEELINTTSFLLKSSRVLNLPCVITEQYPEKLKHTGANQSFPLTRSGRTAAADFGYGDPKGVPGLPEGGFH